VEKFLALAIPVLVAVVAFVVVQMFGATVFRLAKDPAYRAAMVGLVRATMGEQEVPASRWERRASKVLGFVRFGKELVLGLSRGRSFSARALATEAGAFTLAQAAVISDSDLQGGIAERFVLESVVLDRMPLIEIEGNAYSYPEEATLPGVAFRAVNTTYTESTGTYNPVTESLSILGGFSDVDRFIERTQGRTRAGRISLRQSALNAKIKAARIKFQDTFFNGSVAVDANAFDGLKIRLTGAQVLAAATDGMGPVAGGQDFFDALDAVIAAVPGGADAVYANSSVIAKIASSARRLGFVLPQIDRVENAPEGTVVNRRVYTYNGLPLLDPGNKADGTLILPFSETQGTSNAASSVYAVRWTESHEDDGVAGFVNGSENEPFETVEQERTDPIVGYRVLVEAYIGMGVFGKGAARLTGVLNG
jgi:hypothetical protein